MKDKRERPNIKPMITFNGDFKNQNHGIQNINHNYIFTSNLE